MMKVGPTWVVIATGPIIESLWGYQPTLYKILPRHLPEVLEPLCLPFNIPRPPAAQTHRQDTCVQPAATAPTFDVPSYKILDPASSTHNGKYVPFPFLLSHRLFSSTSAFPHPPEAALDCSLSTPVSEGRYGVSPTVKMSDAQAVCCPLRCRVAWV